VVVVVVVVVVPHYCDATITWLPSVLKGEMPLLQFGTASRFTKVAPCHTHDGFPLTSLFTFRRFQTE
jgi:hypothetical protein